MYSLMRCNYGADYEDPQTWTDPFPPKKDKETGAYLGNSYNKMDVNLNVENDMTPIVTAYYAKVEEAKALTDLEPRYAAFAEAEAMLINNAVVIPYSVSVRASQVTKLDVYEAAYAPCGVTALRYKGQHLHDEFVTAAEAEAAEAAWMTAMGK